MQFQGAHAYIPQPTSINVRHNGVTSLLQILRVIPLMNHTESGARSPALEFKASQLLTSSKRYRLYPLYIMLVEERREERVKEQKRKPICA